MNLDDMLKIYKLILTFKCVTFVAFAHFSRYFQYV